MAGVFSGGNSREQNIGPFYLKEDIFENWSFEKNKFTIDKIKEFNGY